MKSALLLTLIFTLFNTGLIWTIQLVHYPGFLHVGPDAYKLYQSFHMRSITGLVGPSMLAELISTILLTGILINSGDKFLIGAAGGLLGFIWIHTAFVASPLHGSMLDGYQPELIKKLIAVNWWRTIAWTIRAVLISYLAFKLLK
jgi:hypothetical protein